MKRASLVLLVLLTAASLYGQVVQDVEGKTDVYLGYAFTRFNSATFVPAFSANGGIGQLQYHITPMFGIIADLGGTHNGNISDFQLDQTAFTYMFGPRVSLHPHGKIKPYGQVAFGGTRVSRSFPLSAGTPSQVATLCSTTSGCSSSRFSSTQNAFSMIAGGGLDVRVGHRVSFRPIELDYYLTRFQPINVQGIFPILNSNRNQNNLRYSAGVKFSF
jgi:opacity protein-like surface antigen